MARSKVALGAWVSQPLKEKAGEVAARMGLSLSAWVEVKLRSSIDEDLQALDRREQIRNYDGVAKL
jgi:antitoxin component of RelBE/YafQ-DinJ toxin-antitoxin module